MALTREIPEASPTTFKDVYVILAAAVGILGVATVFRDAFSELTGLPRVINGVVAAFVGVALVVSFVIWPKWSAMRARRQRTEAALKKRSLDRNVFDIRPFTSSDEDQKRFARADNCHGRCLQWLKQPDRPRICYLTGPSGTGKSSLINAFLAPNLKNDGALVIVLRATDDRLVDRVHEQLQQHYRDDTERPETLSEAIGHACRCAQNQRKQLFIFVDQFEVLLHNRAFDACDDQEQAPSHEYFEQLVAGIITSSAKFILCFRYEYQGCICDEGLPPCRDQDNSFIVEGFTQSDAIRFMESGNITSNDAVRLVGEARAIDGYLPTIRPITLNLLGFIVARYSAVILASASRGGVIEQYLRTQISQPTIEACAERVLRKMIARDGTVVPCRLEDLSKATGLAMSDIRGTLCILRASGLVRETNPLSEEWEISHSFLAALLNGILGRAKRRAMTWVFTMAAPLAFAVGVFVTGLILNASAAASEFAAAGGVIQATDGRVVLNSRNRLRSEIDLREVIEHVAALPVESVEIVAYPVDEVCALLEGWRDVGIKELRVKVGGTELTEKLGQSIVAMTGVERLSLVSLDEGASGSEILPTLSGTHRLKHIRIENLNASPVLFDVLGSMRQLEVISMVKVTGELSPAGIGAFEALSALEALYLVDCKPTPDAISKIGGLVQIRKLEMSGCGVDNVELAAVASLNLNHLNIARCRQITGAAITVLKAMPNLEYLNVNGCLIADAEVNELGDLERLQVLVVSAESDPEALRPLVERRPHLDINYGAKIER